MPWYRQVNGAQWRVLIAAMGVWGLDAVDFLLLTYVLVDVSKQFGVPLATVSLLLLATYGVRWIGGLLFGSLSDSIGRKIPLILALVWFTGCAALTGLSWDFASMVAFRLLLGLGMAPGFSLGATLIAETWPENIRAIGLGAQQSAWALGGIGASLVFGLLYPHVGWRGLFFVGIVPALVLAVFIAFFVPESERWRSAASRKRVAAVPALALFRRHPRTVIALAFTMFFMFFSDWPLLGLFPTYLRSLHFSAGTVSALGLASSVGQALGYFSAGLAAERLGRRRALASMRALGCVAIVVLVVTLRLPVVPYVVAFLCGLLFIGAGGVYGAILSESLSTEVRASGVGFLYNVGSCGGGLAPFVVLSSLSALGISFGAGLAGWTVFGAAIAITLLLTCTRETRGAALDATVIETERGEVAAPVNTATSAIHPPAAPLSRDSSPASRA
ncbi:MAG TPA: MFS transporter [Candidatus Limnocylindria bacterium]|nr:MFS transporter [Candidatus Limnocylindria bacterium]